jgi:hypothetical protein
MHSTEAHTITREELPNGKFRYTHNGTVHTAASKKVYTHASVYRRLRVSEWDKQHGLEVGDCVAFLHTRADIAAKGSPDANRATLTYARVPGVVTIEGV